MGNKRKPYMQGAKGVESRWCGVHRERKRYCGENKGQSVKVLKGGVMIVRDKEKDEVDI